MPILDITYNPYKRKTQVLIDNVDVQTNDEHLTIKEFINNRVPLQTWIESIKSKGWDGIVSHLIRKDDAGEIVIRFTGRKLDFEDLKNSLEEQVAKRAKDCPVVLIFDQKKIKFSLNDHIMMDNIEYVKEKMLSDEFKSIMSDVKEEKSIVAYENLERNFAQAFNSEFRIVLAGTYSCGKSSIINALIGKTILPMFEETTTTKKCKVIHDSSIGEKMRLVALDSSNVELVNEIFEKDSECRNRFEQISPAGQMETNPQGIEEIHIYLDLSHLYPIENRTELSKKFKIVLIDTPGADSRNSATMNDDNEIINHDKNVALSAINGQDREIVIICSDTHYQGTALGDLLYHIHRASKDDNGFNDRFFFVMNKSDEILAAGLGKHKGLFADSISDSSKWGVRDSYLNPKIFMVSAQTKLFVTNGLHKLNAEDPIVLSNDKLDEAVSKLNLFYRSGLRSEACRPFTECDIPCYKKDQFAIEYNQAVASCDKGRALEIQSGIPCVVTAIQDYISRYAYPIKIQKLLDTFEILLDVVKKLSEKQQEILGMKNVALGESNSSREGVEATRAEEERRKEELEKLKERIDLQKEKITEYKPADTVEIRHTFREVWDSSSIIEKTRGKRDDDTMSSSEYEKVKAELTELFNTLSEKALDGYDQMQSQELSQMSAIAKAINRIYEELKGTSLEELVNMSFAGKIIEDPQKIIGDMLNATERGKKTRERYLSRGEQIVRFFKRVVSFGFWGKTGYDVTVYPWSEIKKAINRFERNFNSRCQELDEDFKEKRRTILTCASSTLDQVVEGIEGAGRTLDDYNKQIDSFIEKGQTLDAEITRVNYNIALLNELSERISQTR